MRGMREPRYKLTGLLVLSIVVITLAFLLPPIPQDPAYRAFADQRTLHGVPHFWNVASSLPGILCRRVSYRFRFRLVSLVAGQRIAGLGPVAHELGVYGFFLLDYR